MRMRMLPLLVDATLRGRVNQVVVVQMAYALVQDSCAGACVDAACAALASLAAQRLRLVLLVAVAFQIRIVPVSETSYKCGVAIVDSIH